MVPDVGVSCHFPHVETEFAFRTRVLAGEMLEELDSARATGKRPARLYRLRDRRQLHVFRRALEGGDAAA